jgi:hypothetical protein
MVKTFPPPRAVPDLMEAFRKSLWRPCRPKQRTMTASRPRRRGRRSRRLKSRASGKCCCRLRAGGLSPKRSLRRHRGGKPADDFGGSCAPARRAMRMAVASQIVRRTQATGATCAGRYLADNRCNHGGIPYHHRRSVVFDAFDAGPRRDRALQLH